jgi:hypothetical protein
MYNYYKGKALKYIIIKNIWCFDLLSSPSNSLSESIHNAMSRQAGENMFVKTFTLQEV